VESNELGVKTGKGYYTYAKKQGNREGLHAEGN
jgi:hypothetical protein